MTTDSDTTPAARNTMWDALIGVGLLLTLGGSLGAWLAAQHARSSVNIFLNESPNYLPAWLLGGVAVLGVLLLAAAFVIAAARPQQRP